MGGTFSASRSSSNHCGLDSPPSTPQPPPAKVTAILLGDSGIGAKTSLLERLVERRFATIFITTIGIDYKIYKSTMPYRARVHESQFGAFLMTQHPIRTSSSVPVLPEGILQLIHSQLSTNATWDYHMTIWDVAGQERFRSIASSYTGKMNDVVVFGYDITDESSFENVGEWVDLYLRNMNIEPGDEHPTLLNSRHRPPVLSLVGNKSDCEDSRRVTSAEGAQMAAHMSRKCGTEVVFFETSAKEDTNVTELFDSIAMRMVDMWKVGSRSGCVGIVEHNKRCGIVELV